MLRCQQGTSHPAAVRSVDNRLASSILAFKPNRSVFLSPHVSRCADAALAETAAFRADELTDSACADVAYDDAYFQLLNAQSDLLSAGGAILTLFLPLASTSRTSESPQLPSMAASGEDVELFMYDLSNGMAAQLSLQLTGGCPESHQ